ncbi:MAG: S-layer homology domain-containing protein, partial [Firmicutes bacterium]|nr:S-layer homology domain-containing protein [Bacillota bacterium]
FAPENTITRQDMMVLVGKMLEYKGINIEADASALDKFGDAGDISEYAKPYVAFLTQQGIVSGTGDNIEPKALMTRAQMAVLMKNVNDKI